MDAGRPKGPGADTARRYRRDADGIGWRPIGRPIGTEP
jgi:hypothetical protein